MKKIREILFTIVMVASCGCLLNVYTHAMLPQNNGPTNPLAAASGESFSNDPDGEQTSSHHEKSSEWVISDVVADNVKTSTYPDLSEVCVSEGQAIKKGQKIGERIGSSTSSRRLVRRPLNSFESFNPGPVDHSEEEEEEEEIFVSSVELTDNPWGCTDLGSYVRDYIAKETYKSDDTNNHGRRPKTYEKWLAEKEKNEHEGNFTEPSLYSVNAYNDGTVLFCNNNFPGHSRVTTYHTNMVDGTMVVNASTYDDLSEVYVSEGQAVKKGQKIGETTNFGSVFSQMILDKSADSVFNPEVDPLDTWEIMEPCRFSRFDSNKFELPPHREEGEQATGEQEDDEEGKGWSPRQFARDKNNSENENSSIEDFTTQTETDETDIYDTDNSF